jgi:ketosteroid isomerase-like protein
MKRLVSIAALTILAACSSSTSMSSAASAGDAENAIRRANSEFAANVRAGNAQTIVDNYYAPDAVAMPPNMPALTGREAIRQFWAGFLNAGAIDLALTSDKVTQSGDIAVERGHYDLTITPAGGQAIKEKGKYLVMWKKAGGRWWSVDDIFNSDIPAAK